MGPSSEEDAHAFGDQHSSVEKYFTGDIIEFEECFRKPRSDFNEPSVCSHIRGYFHRRYTKDKAVKFLKSSFPFVSNLKEYDFRQDFLSDVIAGLTVGIMQIPQGMAYAMLSSLPPVCGLYISFFSPLVYFFLGTSRHASMGCISVVSLMIGSVIDTHFPKDINTHSTVNFTTELYNSSEAVSLSLDNTMQDKIELAASVSFISGFIMIVSGRLGLGFITTYMPEPMVSGFTSAVGIIVASNQAKHVFGLELRPQIGSFKLVKTWIDIIWNIKDSNYIPVVITIICMAIMYIVKIYINQRFKHRLKIPIPIEILVVALATTVSHFGNFTNLSIIKEIPAGVPRPSIPNPAVGLPYMKDAFIIGVVAFTQSVSMAKILARKNNYLVDANQEMVAYGASSVVCGVFSGYIPAASVSRSMIQDGAGGKTQVASLFGCIVVLVIILAVGPLFYSLPKCVLSAIIIINLRAMFLQFLEVKPLWRKSKCDFLIWIASFGATLILDADIGIAVGILFSLFTISLRIQRTSGNNVGFIEDTGALKNTSLYQKVNKNESYVIIQYPSPICFANSDKFVKDLYRCSGIDTANAKKAKLKLDKESTQHQNMKHMVATNGIPLDNKDSEELIKDSTYPHIILDLRGSSFIDIAGINALRKVLADYDAMGVMIYIVECNDAVISTLKTTNLLEERRQNFFVTIDSAIRQICQGRTCI